MRIRKISQRLVCAALLGSVLMGTKGGNAGAVPARGAAGAKKRHAANRAVLKARPGYIVGRATTMAGKPLARAEIFAGGTSAAGERTSFDTKTKADGIYALKVPNGAYRVNAKAPIHYLGQTYVLPLHQSDGENDDQDSSGGIIKNFVWKLSGVRAGWRAEEENSHHGGSFALKDENSYNVTFRGAELGTLTPTRFPEGSLITLTVNPQGARIDGTPAGKPIVFQQKAPWGFNPSLQGIPIGPCTLKAIIKEPDGTVKPLRVAVLARPYEFVAARDKAPQPAASTPLFNWNPSASTYTGGVQPVDVWVMY